MEWQAIVADKRVQFLGLGIVSLVFVYTLVKIIVGSIPVTEHPYQAPKALRRAPVTVANIASYHLFGFHRDRFLPQTRLDIQLAGILFNGTESASQALIISAAGDKAQVYKEGEEIPGGVKVYQILPQKVILQHNSKLETLPLERQTVQLN